jgi:hypothetical protein
MAFSISKFLPIAIRARLDGPGDGKLAPYELAWNRRYTPQQGATNYSLATLQLPKFSLSGPLNTNARRFNPLEPARAIDKRRFPNATIGGAGILNGQVMSQPLLDPDIGGYAQALTPILARPFAHGGAIQPAGKA